MYVPLTLYTFPFHNKLSQATKLSLVDMELLIVKSIVTTLSQPCIVARVSMYSPLIV